MECMQYANENQINIIPKQQFTELTEHVFGVIADNLSLSLGPNGSQAIILDGMMTEATKDGYSILMKYRFNNRYKKMIYNLITVPCTRMNNTVGDGTTTAITLTNEVFKQYREREKELYGMYRLPRQFSAAWDKAIDHLIEKVEQKAVALDPEDHQSIYNLAYVVSNGNQEISQAIASVYEEAKSPNITRKDSPTNKSYIEKVNGFEFPANAIDVCYVRSEGLMAEEKNVYVLFFDHKIENDFFQQTLVPMNDVIRSMGKKLMIVAPAYDEYMLETTFKQFVNYEAQKFGAFNLIPLQYRASKLADHQDEDLAAVLQGRIITQDLAKLMGEQIAINPDLAVESMFASSPANDLNGCLGMADGVLISLKNGSIFHVNGEKLIESSENYRTVLELAEAELNDILAHTDVEAHSYSAKVYNARSRLLRLKMQNYIYYVGADSKLQKQILDDTVDDVIKCLRSAIRCGVVPGCQLSIINACREAVAEIVGDQDPASDKIQVSAEEQLLFTIYDMIYQATTNLYRLVIGGKDGMGLVKLLPRWQFTTEEGKEALHQEAMEQWKLILRQSIRDNTVFDIETLEFNPKIITSAETDTMVLRAVSELIKILIGGNQCIFLDADINESHQEQAGVYV